MSTSTNNAVHPNTQSKEVNELVSATEAAAEGNPSEAISNPNDREVSMPSSTNEAVSKSSLNQGAESKEVMEPVSGNEAATAPSAKTPTKTAARGSAPKKTEAASRPFSTAHSALYNELLLMRLMMFAYKSTAADLFIGLMNGVKELKHDILVLTRPFTNAVKATRAEIARIGELFVELRQFCTAYKVDQDAVMVECNVTPALLQSRRQLVQLAAFIRFSETVQEEVFGAPAEVTSRARAIHARAEKIKNHLAAQQQAQEKAAAKRVELRAKVSQANTARSMLFVELEGLDLLTGTNWVERMDEPEIQKRVAATIGTTKAGDDSGGDPA